MPIDVNDALKTAAKYDASTFITVLVLAGIFVGLLAWFKYVYLPWQVQLREESKQRTQSNDLMAQTLSALSGLVSQTHETVEASHATIDTVSRQVRLIMSAKVIESEIFTVIAEKAGVDIKRQLGMIGGVLDEFRILERKEPR